MRFVEKQLYQIAPFPIGNNLNGQFRVKFSSGKGETVWMNLTAEQFKAIERFIVDSPIFKE